MDYQRLNNQQESASDFEDSDTSIGNLDKLNLIDEQASILKAIFAFGNPTSEDDDDPYVEVGQKQKVPRTLFTFKALVYDQHG